MPIWPKVLGPNSAENERANTIRHSGLRVGEILGYRAWAVEKKWFSETDFRLRGVYMRQYIWEPHKPATGDVTVHGIYSFRDPEKVKHAYITLDGAYVIFGTIKMWGEMVEHELGYRAQFAKIVSLDDGEPKLIGKFRKIYGIAG